MIYISIFILLLALSLLEINFIIDKKNKLFFVILFILILLIGTRDGNGADYYRYKAIFNSINENNYMFFDDIGFSIIAVLLNKIHLGSEWIFLVFAGIQVILLGEFIRKNTYYRYPALLIYFSLYMFPLGFNAMAQGISVAIILLTIKYIENKKIIPTLVLAIIAFSFHRVAFLVIVIFIIYKMDITYRNLIYLIVGMIAFSFVLNYLFTSGQIVNHLPLYIRSIFLSYRSQYLESVSIVSILARLIMLCFVTLNLPQNEINERKLYIVYWTGFLFYIILLSNDLLATRINMTLKITEMKLIGDALYNTRSKKTRTFLLVSMSVFLFAVLYSAMGHEDLYPYHSWLLGI